MGEVPIKQKGVEVGEKVLVKAITAIVNREGKKKQPLRKINLSSFEYP